MRHALAHMQPRPPGAFLDARQSPPPLSPAVGGPEISAAELDRLVPPLDTARRSELIMGWLGDKPASELARNLGVNLGQLSIYVAIEGLQPRIYSPPATLQGRPP